MRTKILKIDPLRPDRRKIRMAARVIKRGGLVVFPTETVYGIGADAFNRKASKKIYTVKGRPSDNPLMIHVSDMKMAECIGVFPKAYLKIIKRLWPGPIAFVVDARKGLDRSEVSIRMPDHKVALELIRASGTPIAAPSANISKKPSSTRASHALTYFDGKVDMIIDSGSSRKGIESTILDLRNFEIQRPGAFPVERIRTAFGKEPLVTDAAIGLEDAKKPVAPGMKYKHYSPDKPLFLYKGDPRRLDSITSGLKSRFAFIGSHESAVMMKKKGVKVIDLGSIKRPESIARNLFDSLIKVDRFDVEFAIIETFPPAGIGLGIMNRIIKAADRQYFSTRQGLEALRKALNKQKKM